MRKVGAMLRPLPEAMTSCDGCLMSFMLSPGISQFFRHQAEAINAALGGSHIAIATATSSGKSIVYNVPVIRSILAGSATDGQRSTALYLFPTKALAQVSTSPK